MISIHRLLLASLPAALCAVATGQHTPDEALRMLQEGNKRFAAERSVPQPIGEGVRRTLAQGQSPIAVVVTCADSRVPPEHLFNTGLGELVVVRTAGHVVGSEAIATIEHAVERLNVPLCVVLGHEHCDVLKAAVDTIDGPDASNRLSQAMLRLMERIEPSVRKAMHRDLAGKALQDYCEEEHSHSTVVECMRRSPLLRRFAEVGKFRMVAARYKFEGEVEWLPNRPLPSKPRTEKQAVIGSVPPSLPPHVALRMLRAGHSRFLGDHRPKVDLTRSRRSELASGQQPLAIVLTDSDSRVSPEHVFDAGLGDLYVVRTAGHTLTDETLASIEFAAGTLGASLLVVMGHNRCEPIVAAQEPPEKQQMTPHQRELLRRLEPSVLQAGKHPGKDPVEVASQQNVMRTLHETRSRSPLVRALENQGRFAMLAAYYEVDSGDLSWLKVPAAPHDHGAHAAHAPSGSHGSHGSHGAHGGNDSHGAHAGHGSHDGHGAHEPSHSGESHDAHGHAHGATEHGSHDAHGHGNEHADLPVIDFHAAPIGETASGAHGSHGGHGAKGGHDGHGGHDAKGGHGAGSSHAPHDPHAHHGSHDGDHGAPDAHGTAGGHAAHGEHHDAAGHEDHAHPHDESGAAPGERHDESSLTKRWLDPVVIVGIVGIVSLLGAAVIALRGK